MLTLAALEHAKSVVYAHMDATPCYDWPLLSEAMGHTVWVKHENHTRLGAFKMRSGLVYVERLVAGGFEGDLVTATRGNHGQAIPFAARQFGLRVHVYVPKGNALEKNQAMRAWGAILHEEGDDYDAAKAAAMAHVERANGHFVPAYHPHLVAGVATYAAELYASVSALDVVYVPIGMGSGAAAMIAVRNLLGLDVEVVGVVAQGANAYARSVREGKVVTSTSARTFADGLAVREPHPEALAYLSKGLSRVVEVSDASIAQAMRLLFRTTHNVAEGAGAAAFAAIAQEREANAGRVVAGVLSGGNVDTEWFRQVLAGQTPEI